ncbi:MAG: hypothetical protein PHR56_00375 [Dehalococcoidales bacterium]|nr:hypothetical protein [Dehalococcoidales bacterium]
MKNQRNKKNTEAELVKQAIDFLWNKKRFEDAIVLSRRLLRLRPRYPLYYLILSDSYRAIDIRDNNYKAEMKSQMYWDKAFLPDGKFTRSDYYEQGIEVAARYLLATQDLEKLNEIETKKLQELSTKKLTSKEFYDAILGQVSISKNQADRLAYLKTGLMKAKAGYNQNLYAFDSEGKLVTPTLQEFIKTKLKDPKRQLLFVLSNQDPITGKEAKYAFNILKNFSLDIPSESVIKARQRRSRYYYSHQKERQEYQRLYDSKNRQRKRVRNKLDYSWRQSGLTKRQGFPRDNSNISESV